ncbi:MAG: hypothetical protein H8D23_15665 [Candidatus Brocadiales bacterium]|nr:hypothetical protein [Candidatus Brocadiales bacterium]
MNLEQIIIDELQQNYPDNLNDLRVISDDEATLFASLIEGFIAENVPSLAEYNNDIDWMDIATQLLEIEYK